MAELQNRSLGITVPAPLKRNSDAESDLGSVLTDSLRALAHANVAILNSGTLRNDLKPGTMTYGDVYEVLPFDNTVSVVDLTGDELMSLLRAAFGSRESVFQISGIEVTVARCPKGNQLREVRLGGKPLEPAHSYRVAMPDYLARGGSGLNKVLGALDQHRIDFGDGRGLTLREELIDWWRAWKAPLVAPKPGRITFVDEPAACENEHAR